MSRHCWRREEREEEAGSNTERERVSVMAPLVHLRGYWSEKPFIRNGFYGGGAREIPQSHDAMLAVRSTRKIYGQKQGGGRRNIQKFSLIVCTPFWAAWGKKWSLGFNGRGCDPCKYKRQVAGNKNIRWNIKWLLGVWLSMYSNRICIAQFFGHLFLFSSRVVNDIYDPPLRIKSSLWRINFTGLEATRIHFAKEREKISTNILDISCFSLLFRSLSLSLFFPWWIVFLFCLILLLLLLRKQSKSIARRISGSGGWVAQDYWHEKINIDKTFYGTRNVVKGKNYFKKDTKCSAFLLSEVYYYRKNI